jgi:hypothetical protein
MWVNPRKSNGPGSQRRIARELGIDRETVARHLGQFQTGSEPANAPSGSARLNDGSKPAIAPPGSTTSRGPSTEALADASQRAGRAGECEPWRQTIHDKIDLGLTAQRIYQDLTSEHGFAGSYYSVRRFVRQLEAKQEFPFRRLECGPGEEVQVDFGRGAFVAAGRVAGRTSSASSGAIRARPTARSLAARPPKRFCVAWRTPSGTSAASRSVWCWTTSTPPSPRRIGSTPN